MSKTEWALYIIWIVDILIMLGAAVFVPSDPQGKPNFHWDPLPHQIFQMMNP